MAEIKEMGTVYNSDLLIIGGSIAGLCAGIRAKENNKDLDVLVIDKGAIGFSGQAAKAGNGILAMTPEQDVEKFIQFSVAEIGQYVNDQDYLRMHYSQLKDYLNHLVRWGVGISKNPDGSVKLFPMGDAPWAHAGIELKNVHSLRDYAMKIGVRLLSYVEAFELLTDGDRVIGAVGFDINHGRFHIFNAKAVGLACHGAHFKKMGGMFMAYGTGLGMAYRVGAKMRNAEFSTECDVVSASTYTPIYGACNIICNKDGVNISDIYAPNRVEVGYELVMGMWKEVQEGRGPLYSDLLHPDTVRKEVGAQGHDPYDQRLWPDKHHWVDHVGEKSAKYGRPLSDENPETTVRMNLQAECLYCDMEQKTNVEGLWAVGKICAMGCSYIGFVRGDGLGFAVQTGIRAADSMCDYVKDHGFGAIDAQQVAAYKEQIYAPLNRKTNHTPAEIFSKIEEYAYHIDIMVAKTERSIALVLKDIEEMKKILPELSADDFHGLAKCHEAADSVLSLEFIFRAADMRKETRGGRYTNFREDYPERDDKNWLKWIDICKGQDGQMVLSTTDVPIDRYHYKPAGYETK